MFLFLDPNADWIERSDDRKEKKFERIAVTIPRDYSLPRPVFCPCCERPMRDPNDVSAYDINACCFSCDIRYARPNIAKWKDGWRPNRQEIDERTLDILPKNVFDQ